MNTARVWSLRHRPFVWSIFALKILKNIQSHKSTQMLQLTPWSFARQRVHGAQTRRLTNSNRSQGLGPGCAVHLRSGDRSPTTGQLQATDSWRVGLITQKTKKKNPKDNLGLVKLHRKMFSDTIPIPPSWRSRLLSENQAVLSKDPMSGAACARAAFSSMGFGNDGATKTFVAPYFSTISKGETRDTQGLNLEKDSTNVSLGQPESLAPVTRENRNQ